MERITRFRAGAMVLAFALILGLFGLRTYSLQLLDGGQVVSNSDTYTTYYTVKGARGSILDCNGNVMVGNRAAYDLTFNNFVLLASEDPNGHLLRLVQMARKLEVEYIERFPVSKTQPYEYTLSEQTASWQGYFQAFLRSHEIDSDISAPRLMKELRKKYKIPDDWSEEDARAIIGLRYELKLRTSITNLSAYVFIEDAPDEVLNAILELNIPGLDAQVTTSREYYTSYAAHILGTYAAMNSDEWKIYKELGYKMDDKVGKSGLELAFEQYLHGTDGRVKRTVDKEGNIISEEYVVEPVAGNNVETSIHLGMQMVAEEAMAEVHDALVASNGTDGMGNGADIEGMAVVVMDVRTGEVRVCASYPTFNPATFNEDWDQLRVDELKPTLNRALMGLYPPGSTYKMIPSIAALETKLISATTEIRDRGVFTKYEQNGPKCLIYRREGTTHGLINVTEALRDSCNYFYYELGDQLDWDVVDAIGKALGLGESTGIELGEYTGMRANAENKATRYAGADGHWYKNDQILAAIGQSIHQVTPMQLCSYVSALANDGTRYAATFFKRVLSSDYSSLVEENTREVLSTLEVSESTLKTVKEGMRKVVTEGSAVVAFRGFEVEVCGKTGTAEHSEKGSSNGSFVCYAPMDDPEIAVAVYSEKGGSGAYMARVARKILDYYFTDNAMADAPIYENQVG